MECIVNLHAIGFGFDNYRNKLFFFFHSLNYLETFSSFVSENLQKGVEEKEITKQRSFS